ncbi:hypothetical protein MMC25_003780 [Agyrium rufum]|nr:hypothetical protein [Agyrium rufum]
MYGFFFGQAWALLLLYVLVPPLVESRLEARNPKARILYDAATGPSSVAAPTNLNRTGWTATADSSQSGNAPASVLDGNSATFWHSQYTPTLAPLPHNITINMGNSYLVNGFSYLPRQDASSNGNIGQHTIQLSLDGVTWGAPVASGTWLNDNTLKQTFFASTPAKFVRLSAQTEAEGAGNQWSAAAELNVLTAPDPNLPRNNWVVSADSAEPAPQFHPASSAVDGAITTYWHTQYDGGSIPALPHYFTIDQGSAIAVSGLTYLPRPDSTGANGRVGQYNIQYSTDGTTWVTAASGTWVDDATLKTAEFAPKSARYFRLMSITEAGNRGPWTSASEINLLDGSSKMVNFNVTVDSQETASANNPGIAAADGDSKTFWHTAYSTTPIPGYPHTFMLDLQGSFGVNAVTYVPRQDGGSNGNIGEHIIDLSTDGSAWTTVEIGTWLDDSEVKIVNIKPTAARYVRVTALTEAGNRGPWASAAEISVSYTSSVTPISATLGQWGKTIDFPVIPVAAAVLHDSGEVLVWSSYEATDFEGTSTGVTLTATYNPATGIVSQRTVSNTQHDMFCPGLSIDAKGRTTVTGGNSDAKTSIYDPITDTWIAGAQMNLGRGYQAEVTVSDGRTFTIGGSWSGGEGGKNGEIYDPVKNTWTLLPGCPVAPMLTNDAQGVYRADNHGWLFGWKNSTVFQAGPSAAMNWYTMTGKGGQKAAGLRGTDTDAMNGNAVMYDAVNGKILTVGGATSYQSAVATTNANIITIGAANATASVTKIASMSYARAFANTAVLPNGQIFITGGQTYAQPFTDDTGILYPELFDPTTMKFTVLAPNVTPRTYHSIALLLPDATVLSGGGGLCGTCSVNHFDAQIFSPAYLFNSDGSAATRPKITFVSSANVTVGAKITVNTDSTVSTFSLIRFGSTTHSVNTDQRRIALTPTGSGTSYSVTVPADSGIALPGYWMLFALNASGVPSLANTILIRAS